MRQLEKMAGLHIIGCKSGNILARAANNSTKKLASVVCAYRSRLADFISSCQPEVRSISGCLRESYADCLLSYSGLIGELAKQI